MVVGGTMNVMQSSWSASIIEDECSKAHKQQDDASHLNERKKVVPGAKKNS